MWHMGWGEWITMTVAMVVFWGAIIAFAVWAVRSLARDRGNRPDPRAILEERFARGEISRKEFEDRRAAL